MPTSKIETELLKATKLDAGDYKKRQDMLDAILEQVNAFKDAKWEAMSEPAQKWVNAAIKAKKAEKKLPDFPDVGSVKPGADEEDEKPAKKKKAAKAEDEDEEEEDEEEEEEEEEEEDEKPAKKKKKKPAAEEDDEEEEAPKKKKKPAKAEEEDEEEDEEEEEEEAKPAKGKKKKPAAEEEEEDEEEEEAPKKKKKAAKAEEEEDEEDEKPAKKKKVEAAPKTGGVKNSIKLAIIANPEIGVDEIVKKLGKGGAEVSKVTVSNVRAEFRHTLKLLKAEGKLKGIEL